MEQAQLKLLGERIVHGLLRHVIARIYAGDTDYASMTPANCTGNFPAMDYPTAVNAAQRSIRPCQ
mgnify:CR=1 FL=1